MKFDWKFKSGGRKMEGQGRIGVSKRRLPSVSPASLSLLKQLFMNQPRYILLIGDEGTILLYMRGNTVISRQFVPDASDGNLAELRETINKDKKASITMVIDSVDQSFVQQSLPPVSSLSVQKLIKRKLDRDFKPEDIKGSILLGRDKGGRKDWNFLMVSVEKSPQLLMWLEFIMTFENRFRGIVLLSVEAGIFMKNLDKALGAPTKPGTGSEWKIIVSHNKVGGFRQIILRGGKLIFTRLALPVGEPTPEVIAGNIEQEMLSTIEYLKRFGFNSRNGLDVYIVASEEVCRRVDQTRFETANFNAFSPHVMAQHLGIKGATKPEDQFGDVVLAAAVGIIHKNILKLTTVESRLYDKYQMLKYGQRVLGTLFILATIVYAAYMISSSLIMRSEAQDAEQKQRVTQQAFEGVRNQIADSKIDIDLVGNQIDLFKLIRSEERSPLPFFDMLSQGLKPPVALKSVQWRLGNNFNASRVVTLLPSYNVPGAPAQPGAEAPAPAQPELPPDQTITVVLSLEFPAGLKSPALFKKFSENFLKDLSAALKGYTIAYTAVPEEYLDMKSLQMNFDQSPSENSLGLSVVPIEVTIRGPLEMPKEGAVTP